MLAYHWRKGIPSIVLAIVTVLLAGYSYWFVQPNVKQRYRDICARNFLLIEGNIPVTKMSETSEIKQPWQVETEENDTASVASARGSDERRRLLEQTQLCLRRLTIWDKSDDSVRFQTAQIANHLADWYLDRARALPPSELDKDEIGSLLSRSIAERKKAADAMRAVQKLNGKFAFKAYLWTTRQRLQDNFELPSDELDAITTRISDLLAMDENNAGGVNSDGVNSDAYALMAEVFVRQSLLVSQLAGVDEISELLPLVLPFFDTAQNVSVVDLAWAAEAKSISDIEAGQTLATKALQAFWGKGDEGFSSIENLAAVFRCLILVNSIKEGQVFVSERLQQVAAFEQPRFRSLTAAACLRQIMLNAVADKSDTVSAQASQALFSMSLQLNPDSEQVLALLEKVSNPWTLETSSLRLKELMGMPPQSSEARQIDPALDHGLRPFLNACVGLHDGIVSDAALGDLSTAVKATSVFGVVASRLAMRLVDSDSIPVEQALKWMSTINAAGPEVLVAWSDRARLHLMAKEYSKAIQCYEFLLGKMPGNELLVEAIDAARSQLKRNGGVVEP